MVEGWLVYNREEYVKNRPFADLFVSSAIKYSLHLTLKFADEIIAGVRGSKACVLPLDRVRPLFVINRTRDHLLARCFELAGCRVFNSAEAARICNDKAESHLLAARLGLPQVDMAFCQNTPGSIANHGLEYPVVLKSPYGHGGGDVFLAHNEAELCEHAQKLQSGRVIVQRLSGRPGEDVRVYVLGGKVLQAVKRRSGSDFRANLSLGGSVAPYELSGQERELVTRLLSALPLDFAGVDFILDAGGRFLLNELEDVVGSRSLYQIGGFDVPGLYLDYISSCMNNLV